MTNTEDIEGLIDELKELGVLISEDEESLSSELICFKAAQALQAQQEEIVSLKEDSIRVCNRETELLKEVEQLTQERVSSYAIAGIINEAINKSKDDPNWKVKEILNLRQQVDQLTMERDMWFGLSEAGRKKTIELDSELTRMRKALEMIAGTNDVDGNSQECDSDEEMRRVAQQALQDTPEEQSNE